MPLCSHPVRPCYSCMRFPSACNTAAGNLKRWAAKGQFSGNSVVCILKIQELKGNVCECAGIGDSSQHKIQHKEKWPGELTCEQCAAPTWVSMCTQLNASPVPHIHACPHSSASKGPTLVLSKLLHCAHQVHTAGTRTDHSLQPDSRL